MALDEGAHPHFLAGFRVTGEQLAHHAEFVTRAAVDQQHLAAGLVFDQHRRPGHGVAGAVVAEFLVPHHLAGVFVQRDDPGVQRAKVDLVAVNGSATVYHVAARANVVRQAVIVGPQAFAGLGIEGEYPRVGAGDVHHAVADNSLRLLATLLFVTKGVGPGRGQLEHVLVVDLGQRAPALGVGAHAVLQDVPSREVVVGDVFPGHVLAGRCRACGCRRGHCPGGQACGQQQGLHAQGQGRRGG